MTEGWCCTLTHSAVHLPTTQSWFHGLRAQQRSGSSLYLTEPGGDYSLPFGRWGDPPFPYIEALHTAEPVLIRSAPEQMTASDLALLAARKLMKSCSSEQQRSIGSIIYCHASTNEDIADAIACRLQHELELNTSRVFTLSQNLCSPLIALRLASAMLRDEDSTGSALIVASEKWIHPFVRSFGTTLLFEDGASAARVELPGKPGLQIGAVHHVNAVEAVSPFATSVDVLRQGILTQGTRVLRDLLAHAGLDPLQLRYAVLPHLDPDLCIQVLQGAGLGHLTAICDTAHKGHLAAAEGIANLHQARQTELVIPGELGLIWSAGLHGESACCLLSLNTDPLRSLP